MGPGLALASVPKSAVARRRKASGWRAHGRSDLWRIGTVVDEHRCITVRARQMFPFGSLQRLSIASLSSEDGGIDRAAVPATHFLERLHVVPSIRPAWSRCRDGRFGAAKHDLGCNRLLEPIYLVKGPGASPSFVPRSTTRVTLHILPPAPTRLVLSHCFLLLSPLTIRFFLHSKTC